MPIARSERAQADEIWGYSIFGRDERYYLPMKANLEVAERRKARIIVHTCNEDYHFVRSYFPAGALTVIPHRSDSRIPLPKMWRFLTPQYASAKFYFFKDSDSVVSSRECRVMDHWMQTASTLWIIVRDHPLHVAPIMAGMFGARAESARILADRATRLLQSERQSFSPYSYDQQWLAACMYPTIVESCSVYTSYFYFHGEQVIRVRRPTLQERFIGEQEHKEESAKTLDARYGRIYGSGLLGIPFTRARAAQWLYGRVRPSLALGLLLRIVRPQCSSRAVDIRNI